MLLPRLLLAAVAGLLCCSNGVWATQDKGAAVSLRARWRGSPFFQEAAEMLADDDKSKFWAFLEESFSAPQPSDSGRCWAHVLNLTTSRLDAGLAKMAPLALASRKYSAKLAMYQQVLEQEHGDVQSCCFVDVNGVVATSLEELPGAIQQGAGGAAPELFPFEHVYRAGISRPGGVHAVLYAPVGAACARALHFALKVAANAGHVVYAFRPTLGKACSAEGEGACVAYGSAEPLLLPGWGVEAVLKNTEYSAMDEKDKKQAEQQAEAAAAKAGKAASSSGKAQAALGEHKGFQFDTLVKRKPALAQELLTFRDHLLSSDEEENVKVWDLKDVGLQAAQRIMQASDPLALLTDISQNFPSLVSSLSRQEVNASLRQAVAHNQQFINPGANFMLLNGLSIDINELDYFGLLDRLKSELQLIELLSGLGLEPSDMRQLMQMRAEDTSDAMEETRLDLGVHKGGRDADKVLWLNNLEKDGLYQRYGRQISAVLNVYPGRLRPLALNIYQLVLVVDPASPEGLLWAESLHRMWQDGIPCRFGVALKVPSALQRLRQSRLNPHDDQAGAPPAWEYLSASERLALGMLALERGFGGPAAVQFWTALAARVTRDSSWGDDVDATLQKAFEAQWQQAAGEPSKGGAEYDRARRTEGKVAWRELKAGKGFAAQAAERLMAITTYIDAKGIADFEGPSGWMNGMQVQFGSPTDAGQLQQDVLYRVLMEQQRLQEAVYFGRVEDGDADRVEQLLLKQAGSLARWNPGIIAPTKKEFVLLNSLIHDPDFHALVPRFALPEGAAPPPDPDELDDADLAPPPSSLGGASTLHLATHLVVCNLDSKLGRRLAAEALRYLVDRLPTAPSARVLLLLNPPHQDAALPNAPPTLLEAALHLALQQSPQLSGAAVLDGAAAREAVLSFTARLLGDQALALRLAEPLQSNSVDEVTVVLEYAKQAKLDVEAVKAGLKRLLDVQPDSAGKLRFRPPQGLVDVRTAHARMARSALNLPVGTSCLVSNGRLVVSYAADADASDGQDVLAEDLDLLTSIATKYQANQAMAAHVHEAYSSGRIQRLAKQQADAAAKGAGGGKARKEEEQEAVVARLDDLVAAASGAIGIMGKVEGSTSSKQLNQVLGYMRGQMVEVTPPEGVQPSGLHIVCILNPLTRPAQRISQVLSVLRTSLLAPTITLLLNPQRDLSELPLKSFYRFALPDLPLGGLALEAPPTPPSAYFSRLPRKRVLTLNMDVPEAWLVEPVQAQHDLDNLRLADVPEPVAHAELELAALMLTGSCIDVTAGGNRATPPRGLQLHLGTPPQPHQVDTLVMSNLAYFQLKAAPGRWVLSLAPGRTRELYQLVSSSDLAGLHAPISIKAAEGDAQLARDDLTAHVLISSLGGKHMILRVRKRPGKEKEDVLKAAGDSDEPGAPPEEEEEAYHYGYDEDGAERAKPSPSRSKSASSSSSSNKKPGGDVINVFTVASGHMYERLQKIMMLSVLNHTKSKVKFWFISNYMSPHHKQVIPAMAKKFGFEWEFVTYKWPHWLHKQTDKQRIIWAYKILFLDVLFPLGVERIIFVDSDQVVRADLAELYHMDIKGKPYAYTPFCDNNKEMDEFRFWKGGFWAGHLHGKPYHISALYLVDLQRFRAIAAGDKLRVVYDQLSKDPNSLANLDQDLPNYAQHQIGIFSLPQEWLWCESWCGTATKGKAKTIDLCNNPKTKEPKLSAARRIIAEWPEYDRVQAEFTQAVDAELGFDSLTSAQEQQQQLQGKAAGELEGGQEGHGAAGGADEQQSDAADGGGAAAAARKDEL